jgi:7,8-dihydropterin-6-yl-methyl-4-(beta-D-ribofuranosyl)aminobenzene 5'-phosphate synthase
MDIKITTLSENTANYGFLAEWGLSMLVEADGQRILFDTGLGRSAVQNALNMGIDLTTIDKIVLSHGHADHTNGLREFLDYTGRIDVIAHPDIWTAKYTRRTAQGEPQYIGLPLPRKDYEDAGANFVLSKEPVHITSHIITTGEIPLLTGYEEIENNLFVKENGVLTQDPLADDLSMIIDTEYGLVVILGCAHRGIVNTLRHAQKITGNELLYAAIGGTHLFRASKERVDKTIAGLKEMGIQRLGVSHCTGYQASAWLFQEFGDIFFPNNAGTSFILP